MRLIKHIIEPQRLLLSWQPPKKKKQDRQRLLVAELRRSGDDADLVYLSDSDEFKHAREKGFDCYRGFSSEQSTHKNVLDSFAKRLPPRSRKDYDRFLNALRIESAEDVSDFALLGYSGARLPDDTFTIIHPFDTAIAPFEFMMEVQGYRYYLEDVPCKNLSEGMSAVFVKEPGNEYDPQAIKVLFGDKRAGYVCRGLAKTFHKWLDRNLTVQATLERINGTTEKPVIFLYVTVEK